MLLYLLSATDGMKLTVGLGQGSREPQELVAMVFELLKYTKLMIFNEA